MSLKSWWSRITGGPAPHDDYWYAPITGMTASGVMVTPDRAMQASAVNACVRVISETLASLPAILYRRKGDGKERAGDHPLYSVLHDRPNPWQTAFEFYEMQQAHLCLRGNAYALIIPGRRGAVEALEPVHPDEMVRLEQLENGRLRYTFRQSGRPDRVVMDYQVLHVRGLSCDGLLGVSPITQSRQSIGLALAAEDYGSRMFSNDATPPGILTHPGHFKDKESRDNFRRQWQAAQTGANRGKTAVLEDGMKYEKIAITPEDAQFLETRKFQTADIARVFRVPLVMIGETEKSTSWGTGIEQFMLGFVQHTMRPWLVRWEQALKRDLITDEALFVEFLVDGLLRGDLKSRYDAYASAITNGWMTRNEARQKENMNALDGLDEPLQPMNMTQPGQPEPQHDQQAQAVVRKHVVAASQALARRSAKGFRAWAPEYYRKFAKYMREQLPLTAEQADAYCADRVAEIAETADDDLPALFGKWEASHPAALTPGAKPDGLMALAGSMVDLAAAVSKQPAPVVHVTPAPVNVTAPDVTVTVADGAVRSDVHLSTESMIVQHPKPSRTVTKVTSRDSDGRIDETETMHSYGEK